MTTIKTPILAVETSGNACSAAVMMDEEYIIEYSIKLRHIQSEKIISTIDTVIREAKIKPADLNHIAVSMGPGSFTGLRIGLSAIKGIAAGAEKPVVPVPTFDAFAFQIAQYLPNGTNFCIANKVNRDELYFAKYVSNEGKVENINAIDIVNADEMSDLLKEDLKCFGDFNSKSGKISISYPSAEMIARWSYFFGKDLLTFDYDYLEPFYHKDFIPKVKK